jgi:hypothetical protein
MVNRLIQFLGLYRSVQLELPIISTQLTKALKVNISYKDYPEERNLGFPYKIYEGEIGDHQFRLMQAKARWKRIIFPIEIRGRYGNHEHNHTILKATVAPPPAFFGWVALGCILFSLLSGFILWKDSGYALFIVITWAIIFYQYFYLPILTIKKIANSFETDIQRLVQDWVQKD